jgi:Endomembrane protein 70
MRVDISDKTKTYEVEYTYSVEWTPELIEWKDRLSKYTGSAMFLPGSFEIHWLSVINSFVLVLLLTAFLTIIMLRILKNDFSRYMELDEETIEEEEVCLLVSPERNTYSHNR